MDNVNLINEAVNLFFKRNPSLDIALTKDLIPLCIEVGLFSKEEAAEAWPLRRILDELDSNGIIKNIPAVKPVRKDRSTYWFFVRNKNEVIT